MVKPRTSLPHPPSVNRHDPWSLTVTDPGYRGRVLAHHEDLSADECAGLITLYRALGYEDEHLTPVLSSPDRLSQHA